MRADLKFWRRRPPPPLPPLPLDLLRLTADQFEQLRKLRSDESLLVSDAKCVHTWWWCPQQMTLFVCTYESGAMLVGSTILLLLPARCYRRQQSQIARWYKDKPYPALGLISEGGIEWRSSAGNPVFENPVARFVLEQALAAEPGSGVQVGAGIFEALAPVASPLEDTSHRQCPFLMVGPVLVHKLQALASDALAITQPAGLNSPAHESDFTDSPVRFVPDLPADGLAMYQAFRDSGMDMAAALDATQLVFA